MSEMNVEQARFNMVEQQIRTWEVLDQRVLDVLRRVPREAFVPERYRNLAFSDVRLPIGHGEFMMNPNLEGRLLQALEIGPQDRILEIGTGSGFVTACLASLGGSVLSVDIHADFTEAAQGKLRSQGIQNVQFQTGDAAHGWGTQRYDAIAITGSLPELSTAWQERLAIGGRLFAIVGDAPIMEAIVVRRIDEREWTQESLFETDFPRLVNAARPPAFVF